MYMQTIHLNPTTALFQLALNFSEPWHVTDVAFSEEKELTITVGFTRGAHFHCESCGLEHTAHDTVKRTWRHLNFFQYKTFLHCDVPRVHCATAKTTKNVAVPWSRPDSGFTLLFEAFIMELARMMPMKAVQRIVDEHDTLLFRIIKHYVDLARSELDMSDVTSVCIDETSKAKGHDYITPFIDLGKRRVLFVTEGRKNTTVKRFADDLCEHNASPEQITTACMDLSPAFVSGTEKYLPGADIIFDRFHVMKIVQDAMDKVRKQEVLENPLLKNSKYAILHNPETATERQTALITKLGKLNLRTMRAYQIRLTLRTIYEIVDMETAVAELHRWYFWVAHSRIPQMIKAAKTIKAHWDGVVAFFHERVANGIAEGINSVIQTIKRRARGYRNTDNFITMIYLVCGKLTFPLPEVTGITHGK